MYPNSKNMSVGTSFIAKLQNVSRILRKEGGSWEGLLSIRKCYVYVVHPSSMYIITTVMSYKCVSLPGGDKDIDEK
jgi:hypothetical protein